MQNFDLAAAYVSTIAGSPDAVVDFRCLHDTDKGVPGHVRRGTLTDSWAWLCAMNDGGYGCFMVAAELDGNGQKMDNVAALRCNYIDIDGADSEQQYQRAVIAHPAPSFAVQSSPGKYHVFWKTEPYTDRQRFTTVQKKLAVTFHSDPKVSDATRVLRLAGTMHLKNPQAPHLVTCWALDGYGAPTTVEALEQALASVTVPEGGSGERVALGEGTQAPSLEWLQRALDLCDPNDLDRLQWVAFSSAWKQAGWSLAADETLFAMWVKWCGRYHADEPADDIKQWRSITETELDWRSVTKRVPSLAASLAFGQTPVVTAGAAAPPMPAMPGPAPLDCSGEYLTHLECAEYFKGCTFIVTLGQILGPDGTFYNPANFNGTFGGKQFIITGDGKKTDEPWKAATRSTMWTVPKVHHTRFVPQQPPGAILYDALGRTGVNMYVPPVIKRIDGDVSPFLNHIAAMIPDEGDRKILFDWMAHIVKYPGWKIPWAPVIQSVEGIGKGVIKAVMTYAVGMPYVHFPEAQQLADSGGKFNAWMRNRVFILADEIKVDEKRHMVEVLKPLISEKIIEIQGKGQDQKMEDNCTNWGFFSNWKNAVPVSKNGRRYAIFFSPIQSEADLMARGMNDAYMKALFAWLDADGAAIVANWLHSYPIEKGDIPMRAPKTTSWAEAINLSRSPIEQTAQEAIEDGLPGFRGGWVSSVALIARCKAQGAVKTNIAPQTIGSVMETMGYVEVGRAPRPYMQEALDTRTTLYALAAGADVTQYGRDQGYE